MFENIRVFTSDTYWKQILTDIGFDIVDDVKGADVDFDGLNIPANINLMDLRQIILSESNYDTVINKIFHKDVVLSKLQKKILNALYKYGELDITTLKQYVGIDSSIVTHTVETAIYKLRKTYGHDLIYNIEGKYKLGHL